MSRIIATGAYLPGQAWSNDQLINAYQPEYPLLTIYYSQLTTYYSQPKISDCQILNLFILFFKQN